MLIIAARAREPSVVGREVLVSGCSYRNQVDSTKVAKTLPVRVQVCVPGGSPCAIAACFSCEGSQKTLACARRNGLAAFWA